VFDEAALALERFEHLPDHPESRAGLARARETFGELGATPWLRRAGAAAAGGSKIAPRRGRAA
jgi:hypothetical protein